MRRFLITTVLAAATLVGSVAGAPPAQAGTLNVWHTYYYNYFNSETTCKNRGYAMTTPGHSGYVPGMIAYYCYYTGPKWSMDVLD